MTHLHYSEQGKGEALILLHGFCESGEIWTPLANTLSERYRVIFPDLPGFGMSPLVHRMTSMDDYAVQVYNLLRHLSIPKAVLVGHSMGGYVALAFAEKYPFMLSGLGMFYSTALADQEEKKHSRNKTIGFIKKHGVKVFAESFVPPLFSQESRSTFKTEIEQLTHIAATSSLEGVLAATEAMRDRPDRLHVLAKATFPVLYVVGMEDASVPLEKSREQIAQLPHAYVHWIDAGHNGYIEKPVESLNALVALMQLAQIKP